ncbi:MAG: hypothetical protein QM731_11170 [Chitinophagaceae bacterium]
MKNILSIFVGVSIMVMLAACSSTRVTSSWKASDNFNVSSRKVLVLGVMNTTKDRAMKEHMEQNLAEYLRSSGINAVAASNEFSPKAFNNMNEDRAMRSLKNKGYDAVMTIVLLDKSKERTYNPGTVMYEPWGYYNRFWGYYRTMYGRVYTPGYYTTNTSYFWESNLYNLNNNQLLYSVQSKSFDPSSYESLGREYAKQVINDMNKQGLLVKK